MFFMALNFDEFQKVVETAQQADAVKSDLKRALRKVNGALSALQTAMSEMETVLSDEYVATPKTRKSRQTDGDTNADGSARKRPGRPKKNA